MKHNLGSKLHAEKMETGRKLSIEPGVWREITNCSYREKAVQSTKVVLAFIPYRQTRYLWYFPIPD